MDASQTRPQPQANATPYHRPLDGDVLLEVRELKTHFALREGIVRAVDGVSFTIERGRTLGIVGESGCGKSVTAQSILRIVPRPGRIVSGEIIYHRRRRHQDGNGQDEVIDLTKLDPYGPAIRSIRGNEISYIFQEPMASLSPVHTIGHQMIETIRLHQRVSRDEARQRAIEVLREVGMVKPSETIDRYAHQLSGGQRQRAMIALALSCRPSLLIADEPTTALDVTTEAQILDLMRDVQREYGMAIQFITHNLGVIAEMADDVVVMYLGRQVERASVDDIFFNPRHPYTRALLRSIPKLGRKTRERLESIRGMVPDPFSVPRGCAFHPRCSFYRPGVCDDPSWIQVGANHWVRCNRAMEPIS
jgi:oligopeptide/dipeptide ABC transporter ATP-binding protein